MNDIQRVFGDGLAHRVTVYVPSTVNVSEALDESAADDLVNRVQRFLSQEFGGATSIPAQGAWIDADGGLVEETITLVYAAASELTSAQLETVQRFLHALAAEFGQEAVAVEIDGVFYLTR